MRITDVRVIPVEGDKKLKAYVTIRIDECFVVRDMKIIDGTSGLFVAMPAKKMKDGSYKDLIHPLDKSTRQLIEDTVMNEYKKVCRCPQKEGYAGGARPPKGVFAQGDI